MNPEETAMPVKLGRSYMSTFTTCMTIGLVLITAANWSSAKQEKSTPRLAARLEPIIVKLIPAKTHIHPADSIELRVEVWNEGSKTLFIGSDLQSSNSSRLQLYLQHDSQLDRPMSNAAAEYPPSDNEPLSNLLAREWLPLAPTHFYGQTIFMSPSDF